MNEQWADDLLLRLQAAEPVEKTARREPRRVRRLAFAVAALALLSVGVAYGVNEWALPAPPPPGWENDPRYTGMSADKLDAERQQAVRAAERATPLPPGATYERPAKSDLAVLDPTGAASLVLIRRECVWKQDLLSARTAGDAGRMERDVSVLVEPIWLRYHAPVEQDEVARIQRARYRGVVAGNSGAVAMLRQDIGINCTGTIAPTSDG